MNKLITLLALLSISACSTVNTGMQQFDTSPRGISIKNVIKKDREKAYMAAEKYCAKYAKVPRVLKSFAQEKLEDFTPDMSTIKYECLKPNH